MDFHWQIERLGTTSHVKVVVKIITSTTPSRLSLPPLPGSVLKVYMVLSNFGADQEEKLPLSMTSHSILNSHSLTSVHITSWENSSYHMHTYTIPLKIHPPSKSSLPHTPTTAPPHTRRRRLLPFIPSRWYRSPPPYHLNQPPHHSPYRRTFKYPST